MSHLVRIQRFCQFQHVDDVAVLPPHVGALQQQQQQQQHSRMLGLMQSTAAAQNAVNPTQFPPPAAPRMPFHSASSTNTARSLFPNTTESSAPNPDSVYYPRPPVFLAVFFTVLFTHLCLGEWWDIGVAVWDEVQTCI